MTNDTVQIQLTYDELETLDRVLQDHVEELEHRARSLDPEGEWDQNLLTDAREGKALRKKLDNSGYALTGEPLEKVQAAHDAVTAADERVSQLVEQRRQAILAALEAGYTQTALANKLDVTQPRIAHMKTRRS